jgi:hypothetical protein
MDKTRKVGVDLRFEGDEPLCPLLYNLLLLLRQPREISRIGLRAFHDKVLRGSPDRPPQEAVGRCRAVAETTLGGIGMNARLGARLGAMELERLLREPGDIFFRP